MYSPAVYNSAITSSVNYIAVNFEMGNVKVKECISLATVVNMKDRGVMEDTPDSVFVLGKMVDVIRGMFYNQ
jgi:hypothetical protein